MTARLREPRFPEPEVPAGATALAARLRALVAADPDRPLVTEDTADGPGVVRTRAEFDARTNRLARAFADRGVRRGDLVSIALPNTAAHLESSVAAWKVGAVPQPLSARLPAVERDAVLAVAAPALVVDTPVDAGSYDDGPLPDVVGPSWKAPTSGGSTGTPKVIVAGQAACVEQVLARADGLRIDRDGVFGCTAPLHHNAPFMFTLMALLQGHHVVLMGRFDAARALALIPAYGVTWLYAVPTMMSRMLRLPDADWAACDTATLRTVLHVGAPCPPEVKRGWIDRVGAETVFEIYSGTESQAGTAIDGHDWLAHPGSVGRVTRGEITVRDDEGRELGPGVTGEIWMRSGGAPTYHYLGASARERDGWESLGDMGSLDADGYLYLADRRADMILVGGANVYPAEVEAALTAHPGVRDAVVVGLPDADYGHVVHAVVQAEPGIENDLREFLDGRLSRAKQPRSIDVVDHPLRDDAGKVRRSEIAARAADARRRATADGATG
ncbi:AMP-binding protein [Pseudonocardia sp. ICBG1122]|nr:AMP-binding protein [Pseudonocardia pini]